MRPSTILSIAALGLSGVALAQVGQTPVEQKLGNDIAVAENRLGPPTDAADQAPGNSMTTPSANRVDAAPPAGEPSSASSAPPR